MKKILILLLLPLFSFSQVLETSENTLRYKNDGSQTFVKFKGTTPDFLEGETQYTYSEFLTILKTEDNGWISEDEI